MEIFAEYIVKKKKKMQDILIIISIVLLALVLTQLCVFSIPYVGGIFILFVAVVWCCAYFLIKRQNVEFEYILTNNELDIDKIMGKGVRKRLVTVDFKKIERCASIYDESFENYSDRITYNYAGDMSGERVYFVDYTQTAEEYRVIFQPNRKILQGLKTANPRLVSVRDDDVE